MKNIGFNGGSSIFELGPQADTRLFFECLNMYVAKQHAEHDWNLLTDRLYRRYLKLEELDQAVAQMNQVREYFAKLPNSAVDWQGLTAINTVTRLDPNQPTLAEVFSKYFEGFSHCVESAKVNYEGFKLYPGYQYEPVRIVVSDIPQFFNDKNRPLADYDALSFTDQPFWLR